MMVRADDGWNELKENVSIIYHNGSRSPCPTEQVLLLPFLLFTKLIHGWSVVGNRLSSEYRAAVQRLTPSERQRN